MGIAWYYNPGHNGRKDGRHLEWREDHAWRALDPELFDALCNLPVRSVAALEQAKIWPENTLFYREPIPHPSLRNQWSARMLATLAGANLIFLDPDNGLGLHPKNHATFIEVRGFRTTSRTLVCIKFPAMVNYEVQVQKLHDQLKLETGTRLGFTLRTNVSVPQDVGSSSVVQRPRWFPVIDADATLVDRAHRFSAALSSMPRASARIVSFEYDEQ